MSPGSYPHEWFDICASADRHATPYPETLFRRRERLSRVSEWDTILAQQMTVALVIKPDGVNVHLAPSFVSQDEVLRGVPRNLHEPVGRQSFPHPGLMGVPHDEVQVLVIVGTKNG